jgi:iron complex transport system substrate-binding protein
MRTSFPFRIAVPLRISVRRAVSGALFGVLLAAPALTISPASAASKPDTFPVKLKLGQDGGIVSMKRKPTRIVSISPTSTEILFAIGAGKQVVAVDDFSTFPQEAPRTKLSGFQPNVEAIVGYKPDLVVMSQGGKVADSLRALKIPVVVHPAATAFGDTYRQMAELGRLTGTSPAAATSIARMKSQITAAVAGFPKTSTNAPLSFFHELDPTLYSVTSQSFVGQVYSLFGLKNVADAAPGAESGYPQLNAEYLVKTNPDIIFLADTKCCAQNAAEVAKRPGWDKMSAVQRKAIVELDDDIASRWGPRVPLFVEAVSKALTSFAPAVQKAA